MGNINCKKPINPDEFNGLPPLYQDIIDINHLIQPKYIELFNLRRLKECEIELLLLCCTKPQHIEANIIQLLKEQVLGTQYCNFLIRNIKNI